MTVQVLEGLRFKGRASVLLLVALVLAVPLVAMAQSDPSAKNTADEATGDAGSFNSRQQYALLTIKQLREAAGGLENLSDEELFGVMYEQYKSYYPTKEAFATAIGYERAGHAKKSFADRLTEKAVGGVVLGGVVGVLFALLALVRHYLPRLRAIAKRTARASVESVASGVANAGLASVHATSRTHDAFYAQALGELDDSRHDKATWARALASSDGDDGRARANYIKLRVAQLGSEAR